MKGKLLKLLFFLIIMFSLPGCKEEEKCLPPALITVPVRDVTPRSAVLGGFITNDGGADVTARGIYWGITREPEISGSRTDNGKGIGRFTSTLNWLDQNTLYYAKAFAANKAGIAYGNEVQFRTKHAVAATVLTKVANISYYEAMVETCIPDDGGTSVIEKGVCWSELENPTILNSEKIINAETNSYSDRCYWCNIGPLKPESDYHARAYAINKADTSYGEDATLTTLAVPVVTTGTISDITAGSAIARGNVTSVGDAFDPIETGICYGTGKDPAINGTHVKSETSGTGEFTCNLTLLASGTLYYVRAYVAWYFDWDHYVYTVYGNETTFTTH